MAPNTVTSRKAYMHPIEKERDKFALLNVNKAMTNEEYIGIMLRDDNFLNIMSNEPTEDIKKLWCEMLGKTLISPDSSATKKRGPQGSGVLKNYSKA